MSTEVEGGPSDNNLVLLIKLFYYVCVNKIVAINF